MRVLAAGSSWGWSGGILLEVRMGTADRLEQLAGDLHSVAFDFREPARSHGDVERRISEVERICSEARAAVRGRIPQ